MVAAFAGLVFAGAFEPLGLWFLAVIAYVIFMRIFQKREHLYRNSFIFGFVGSFVTLWWAGKYVGPIPLAFLALLHGLFYIPIGLLGRFTKNEYWVIPTLLIIEEVRARLPFGGFSWMRVAFSQADAPYAPVISIGGAILLSAWVLVISFLLLRINPATILLTLAILALPLLVTNSYSSGSRLAFIGIQGNTPSVGLTFNDRAEAVFHLHVEETKKANVKNAKVIIWPENAIDVDPFANSQVQDEIKSLTSSVNLPLIAGAVSRVSGQLENVSIMYGSNGEVVSLYSKQYLTPFGEYIPLRNIARMISPFVDDVTDFHAGKRVDKHTVDGFQMAPIICYELLSDSLVQNAARESDAIIAQTNSATFAGTSESTQQLNITRLRAMENAREIVSISTIGVSAHIDINGRVISATPENVPAVLTGNLRSNNQVTMANWLGGFAPVLVIAIFLVLPAALRIVRSR